MSFDLALVLVLLVPFFGGVINLLLPEKYRRYFSQLITIAIVSGTIYLGLNLKDYTRYEISGWQAPLGINLHIDGIALAMLILTGITASSVSVYSFSYFKRGHVREASKGFWPLFCMLWGSLNTVFLVSDLFTMYVGLELITFASVALITIANDQKALDAALTYLMTALLGSAAYLLGVGIIYGQVGVLDWSLIPAQVSQDIAGWVALCLMTMGLITKAALFPLHFWLPGAHAIAPAPVSALLSALVVKAPFFIMLRIWVQVYPGAEFAAHVIGALGAGAIVWGSFQAIIQDRIKIMVAYSTVAQLGYLFLAFPILSVASKSTDLVAKSTLWEGVIYFAISHGVAKSAMFLVTGIVLQAAKTDYLKDMRGAVTWVPTAVLVWGLAGISLIGLPPSGGFIAKWQLLTSAIRFGQWAYAVVIIFGGLLASGYVFRVLWYAFLTPEKGERREKVKAPRLMLLAALFLGATIVVMGIWTADILSILQIGMPFDSMEAP